jgi:hypothetical protein
MDFQFSFNVETIISPPDTHPFLYPMETRFPPETKTIIFAPIRPKITEIASSRHLMLFEG